MPTYVPPQEQNEAARSDLRRCQVARLPTELDSANSPLVSTDPFVFSSIKPFFQTSIVVFCSVAFRKELWPTGDPRNAICRPDPMVPVICCTPPFVIFQLLSLFAMRAFAGYESRSSVLYSSALIFSVFLDGHVRRTLSAPLSDGLMCQCRSFHLYGRSSTSPSDGKRYSTCNRRLHHSRKCAFGRASTV